MTSPTVTELFDLAPCLANSKTIRVGAAIVLDGTRDNGFRPGVSVLVIRVFEVALDVTLMSASN